jgi:hypothetical protein
MIDQNAINPINTPNISAYCDDSLIDFIATLPPTVIDELESTLNHLESLFMTFHNHSYETARTLLTDISSIFDNARDLNEDD